MQLHPPYYEAENLRQRIPETKNMVDAAGRILSFDDFFLRVKLSARNIFIRLQKREV